MKAYLKGLLAFSVITSVLSCRTQEPPLYSHSANGIHFDYRDNQLSYHLNFADHVVGQPESVPVTVKLKRLGYLLDKEVSLVLKAREVKGKPMADVRIPEIVLAPKEYEKEIEILVQKPKQRDEVYAVELYFDTNNSGSTLGKGVEEKSIYTIEVEESYSKPKTWDHGLHIYLGAWTPDKYIYLANILDNSQFVKTQNYEDYYQYNRKAVEELRKLQQETPGRTIDIEIPFSDEIKYPKPFYWGDKHDQYLGSYKASTFKLLYASKRANTSNEIALLGDQSKLKQLNQEAMLALMRAYNNYFDYQYPGNAYKENAWLPYIDGVEYNVIAPKSWVDNASSRSMLEKYYGAYSEAKYKFMLKVWAKANPGDRFNIAEMFPVSFVYEGGKPSINWDSSLGGEPTIKRAQKIFYDEWKKDRSNYSFSFPEEVQ